MPAAPLPRRRPSPPALGGGRRPVPPHAWHGHRAVIANRPPRRWWWRPRRPRRSLDLQLAQLGPVVLLHHLADDPGSLGQVLRQRRHGGPEVIGLHMRRTSITVAKCLDEHVLS